MRKLHLIAVLVGLLATCSATAVADDAPEPPPHGTVWVTERSLGSVAAFDAATGKVLGWARTGATPIGVTQPHGTGKVYTSDEDSNQLSVIDRRTFTPRDPIPMGPKPHHLMASVDGTRVYVAEFGAGQIGVVDTASDQRIATFFASLLPEARTHAVFVTRDGRHVYAANTRADRSQPGDIAKLDARTGQALWEHNLSIGVDPSEVLVTPDGKIAYVSVRGENKVKKVDVSGNIPVVIGEAVVGTQPDTLQLGNGGATLVVALRGKPAQVSLVDTDTLAVRLVTIPTHTTTGHHWLSADGKITYVAVESPGGLAVIDNKTGGLLADYPYPDPPGGSRPHGVFAEPESTGEEGGIVA